MANIGEYLNIIESLASVTDATRKGAEEKLSYAQERDPNYGVVLLEIALNMELVDAAMHASVYLKNYVKYNWGGILGEGRCKAVVTDQTKHEIKEKIFGGLSAPNSRVRTQFATAISLIASQDWPEAWPLFTQKLEMCLQSEVSRTAALRVLNDFSEEISEKSVNDFVSTFFAPLAAMIVAPNDDYLNKMYAIEVFDKIFQLATECDAENKKSMYHTIHKMMELVFTSLQVPAVQNFKYYGFQGAAVRLASRLLMSFSKKTMELIDTPLNQNNESVLSKLWSQFNAASDVYCLNCVDAVNDQLDLDGDDEAGTKIGISQFLCDCIQFIQELQTKKRGRKLLDEKLSLAKVIAHLIKLSQISSDTLEAWDDIEIFQAEEDMSGVGRAGVRTQAQETLTDAMPCEYPCMKKFIKQIWQGIFKVLEERPQSWQIYEAAVLTLNGLSGLLGNEDHAKDICREEFECFLGRVVAPKLQANEHHYLTGRVLIFGGKYCQKMDSQTTMSMLECVSRFLQEESRHCKILAIRSLHSHIENLIEVNRRQELVPTIETNIKAVLNLAKGSFKTELLPMCLEILHSLYEIDEKVTARYYEPTCEMLMILLEQNTDDPLLAEDVLELLSQLVKVRFENTADKVVEKITPKVAELLTKQYSLDEQREMMVVFSTTVESIEKIAKSSRNAKNSVSREAFSAFLKACYLPAVAMAVRPDADSAVVQNAVDASKAIFTTSYGSELMLNLKSPDGKAYIQFTLHLIETVLRPDADESAALNLGKLITSVVAKCGQELQQMNVLEALLNACLGKLKQCATLSVQQSLLLVFCQLMCEDLGNVVRFIEQAGDSQFFYPLLVEKYADFFGYLERKIGCIALAKLLEHFFSIGAGGEGSLAMMPVQGDEIFDSSERGRSTRRSCAAKPKRYQQIPLVLKVYKLCLQEVQNQIEKQKHLTQTASDSEDDEYSDDEENSQDDKALSEQYDDMLMWNTGFDDEDCLFDQIEVEQNPFGQTDVVDNFRKVIKAFQSHDNHLSLVQQLNADEMEVAQGLLQTPTDIGTDFM